MLVIFASIAIYLLASMPGARYLHRQVEQSSPSLEKNAPENIKVLRYLEFGLVWQVLVAEIIKIISVIFIMNTGSTVLLGVFMLALAYGVWDRSFFREETLYLAVCLMLSFFWVFLIYILFVLIIRKSKSIWGFFNLGFSFMFSLGLWSFNAESEFINFFLIFFAYSLCKIIYTSFFAVSHSPTRLKANKL